MPRRKNMVRPFVALCTVLAASLLALPAQAQWKWKDKAGHTQYSDLPPPPGTAEQDILSRPAGGRRAAAPAPLEATSGASAVAAAGGASRPLAPRTADADLEAKRKQVEADQAARAKLDQERVAAAKADNCTRARGQIKALDGGMRLARTNEKGEREVLDDKQRADETKRTQDIIASDCK